MGTAAVHRYTHGLVTRGHRHIPKLLADALPCSRSDRTSCSGQSRDFSDHFARPLGAQHRHPRTEANRSKLVLRAAEFSRDNHDVSTLVNSNTVSCWTRSNQHGLLQSKRQIIRLKQRHKQQSCNGIPVGRSYCKSNLDRADRTLVPILAKHERATGVWN